MVLKVYNTELREKEVFRPIKEGKVNMYVCGPTVYGRIHIGNARTFTAFDILYRYLKYRGFDVKYVQNITDVGHLTDVGEDKIMVGARERDMEVFDFVEEMIGNYKKDLQSLNILFPDRFCRASRHISDMIEVVQKLIENGYGYESNGFVYYDISKFDDYGRLSGQNPEELQKKIDGEEHGDKRNKGDFVLWFPCPKDYPMKWESPWGTGFPGWHIECSTMSSKYLGLPFDIHGGGKDLIFPHHEDEIAQAEGATGKKFVNYWLHSEFIKIEGEKMSKSLGNVISAHKAVEKYGWRPVRYLLISAHYRKELNFTEETMRESKKAVDKLRNFVCRLREEAEGKHNKEFKEKLEKFTQQFEKHMDNDLNVPQALSSIFKLINTANKYMDGGKLSKENAKEALNTLGEVDKVLGLKLLEKKDKEIPKAGKKLVEKREKLRKEGKYKQSDQIRDTLREKYNVIVEDAPEGPKIKKK